MASKKTDETQYGNLQFVQLTLREAEKVEFDEWLANNAFDPVEMIDQIIQKSFRITIKIDYNHRCFQSSVTQQDNKHPDANKLLVTRAGNVEELISLTFYKLAVMLEWEDFPTQGDYSTWG